MLYYIQDVLIAWITVFALTLLVIGVVSYRRTANRKILYITVGFALFFIKGVILSVGLYTGVLSSSNIPTSFVIHLDILLVLDLLILSFLYLAIFKR